MDRGKTPQTPPRCRAFTLVELIVVIVVLVILASIAIVGYKTVVDKSVESKQTLRMAQILKEAKVLYTQRTYSGEAYSWNQAVADAVDDLPVYSLNAWSEGVTAANGSNLNTATNGWTVQTDTGSGVFSAAPNDLVVSTSAAGIVYVASTLSSTRGVFGMISATTAPVVWGASCLGSSCDAESAAAGPPAGGAYSAGTTTAPTTSIAVTTTTAAPTTTIATPLTLSYATGIFSVTGSSEMLTPTASGSPSSYSYTGTLPTGVTFSTATGAFTGPVAWSSTPYAVVQVTMGLYHTCALLSSGAVKCWGTGQYGVLGNGSTANSAVPVEVTGLGSGVTQIDAGERHTCALLASGAVKCWGYNSNGRLGDGSTTDSSVPVQVTGLTSGVSQVSAGGWGSCALLTSGSVKCWGRGASYALGDGTVTDSPVPVQVVGLTSGVSDIASGGLHTCALISTAMKCWGYGNYGQIGIGSTANASSPVAPTGITSGVSNATGDDHTCAVVSGAAKCWGSNSQGAVGDATTTDALTPQQVTGLTSGVTQVAAGKYHTCAVVSGAAKCWGMGQYGGLGNGAATNSPVPVQVTGLTSGVSSISSAYSRSCVILSTGAVKCWGYNGNGVLGDGTTTNSSVPVSFLAVGFSTVITVTSSNGASTGTASVTLRL